MKVMGISLMSDKELDRKLLTSGCDFSDLCSTHQQLHDELIHKMRVKQGEIYSSFGFDR